MVDFVLAGSGNNPFLYYEGSRDPGATEPDIDQAILNANYFFFVRNTTTGSIFAYVSGTSGSFVWKKLEGETIVAAAHIADAATDAATNAPTNLNVVTTLLGTLTGEVNATNAKQNALAAKYNDLATKFNVLMDHLEAQGLQLTT